MYDALEGLFARWPRPWVRSDTRHAGLVTVFASDGVDILCTGDMEDCEMAEITLANAIAALPVLLDLARAVAQDYEDAADWKDARSKLLGLAQEALAKLS